MPARRNAKSKNEEQPANASATVLLFPARKQDAPEVLPPGAAPASAKSGDSKLPETPAGEDRPALFTPRLREWLRIAVIASVVLHGALIFAFHLRNEDDLARASGAAASASSDGAIVMEVEVIVDAPMPVASKQTNFTKDVKLPSPSAPQLRAEPKPQPKQEQARIETAKEAEKIALPEVPLAPPKPVDAAPAAAAPPANVVVENPQRKETVKEKTERQAERKTANASPSAAANPNRSAASASQGRAGAGGAADAGGRTAISSYQAQVLAHLQRHRVYPAEAQSRGITGVARVRFSLVSDGRVISSSLAGSSGNSVLDQAALAMVRRASPFPAFPAGIARAQLDFAAPVRFDIR